MASHSWTGPLRWLFADRTTGRIVIVQAPNLLVWIVLLAAAASFVVPAGRAATAVYVAEALALASWGADELARGVNPWRRLLGAAALVWIVFGWLPR